MSNCFTWRGKMEKDSNEIIRTTVYIPRRLHESAKIMAVLTRTNLSHLMRVALAEKIKNLKELQSN